MYDEVIRIDPTYAEAYCNKGYKLILLYWLIGSIFGSLKKYDEAIQMYDEAIKINPKDVEAYFKKGWIFILFNYY